MELLVYGDLHLKPAASDHDIEAVVVPDGIDAVVVLGDLVHRDGPEDVTLARRFVEAVGDTPLVYVPGNHDPAPTHRRVVDGLDHARPLHDAVVDAGDVTLVGHGCERRTLSPALDQCAFSALDPTDAPRAERRYLADSVADDVEAACHAVVRGDATWETAATRLGIAADERAAFRRALSRVEERYDALATLLDGHEDVLLLTHVPPFNTSFDRHHSVGTRETDREWLHTGSLAQKLAIRDADVFAALSGHSHVHGYDAGEGSGGRPHLLNLGLRGIGQVTVDPSAGRFGYTRVDGSDW